ncbi:MAG: AAA family ATPase [Paracoccus sp. (in: a-proteobacteria)]|uniref:AAA family ATPase n=1 Tax=Paracoccus sp. TaxID=267 RepID=UPI0039191B02
MARSDLILNLVKASLAGDSARSRTIAEEIAVDERAKKHGVVADRISRLIRLQDEAPSNSTRTSSRSRDGDGGISRREPTRPMGSLLLPLAAANACHELIEEQRRADLLRVHGLEPRHRMLLVGPPGNGKTSLAEALAYELALPLFIVRYDAVITSYLGETAQRLRKLFDYVKTEPCVLFFDEFDAIGKERGDLHESGEIKRVVTTLLLQLDDLPSYCVLVGATNHPELLDRATWRRFEVKIELGTPTADLMISFFSRQLQSIGGTAGYTPKRLFDAVRPQNFSEAEDFFLGVRRQIVMNRDIKSIRSVIDDRVRAWSELTKTQWEADIDDRHTDPAHEARQGGRASKRSS